MPDQQTALASCPFCGHATIIVEMDDSGNHWNVRCELCCANTFGSPVDLAIAAWNRRPPAPPSEGAALVALKSRIDARLNGHLCDMREGWDDSVVGFNTAWDIVRAVFAEGATTSQPAGSVVTAAQKDVLAERQRQVEAEGWTPEHDDTYTGGELAMAAACYAAMEPIFAWRDDGEVCCHVSCWPWDDEWWRPRDRRRNLVKAGALILAEIERLDRAAGLLEEGA